MIKNKRLLAAFVLLGAGGVGGVLAGFGTATGSPSQEPHPVQFAHAVTAPTSVVPTTREAILATVASRMNANQHGIRAAFGRLAVGRPSENGPAMGTAANDALNVTVTAKGRGALAVKSEWEAELLGSAVNDELIAHGLAGLSTVAVTLELPSGELVRVGSAYGNVVPEQQFKTTSAGTFERELRTGVADVGLTLNSITFERPQQLAPVIYATTADPPEWVHKAEREETFQTMLGNYRDLEGFYIEVDDVSGNPVWVSSMSNRAGSGGSWIRPDLAPRRAS
jgi:hypothetical protein